MKELSQFRLLVINAFRILWRTKILVMQLILLLLIGVTILAVIVLSNNSLEKSKQAILSNGNLASFTVSIPEEIRQQSINNSNQNDTNASLIGMSPADKELQQELQLLQLQYSLSRTINVMDILSGNNFVVTIGDVPSSMVPDPVNKLVLEQGSYVPNQIYTPSTSKEIIANSKLFGDLFWINDFENDTNLRNRFKYENYMKEEPWIFGKLMVNSIWGIDEKTTETFIKLIEPLATIPKNSEEYNQYYNLYSNGGSGPVNKESYWYKFRESLLLKDVRYNGFGFDIDMVQTIPLAGPNAQIPLSLSIYDPTSYFVVASSNFINANKGKKEAIPHLTLTQALQLPFKANIVENSSINPGLINKVYNPITKTEEVYPDFITWVNSLDDRYKVTVNSQPYVIVGSGISANMMYPVVDSNQLLVNSKNSAVLYLNESGFERATYGASTQPEIYYSVKDDHYSMPNSFVEMQHFTTEKYGKNTAYKLDDPSQPNYLIYIRANFLDNLQKMIFIITLIIGIIIGCLSVFFICTLLRSIIKQSKITFGVGLANGISKTELALSFFPLSLIPAIFCGVFGYLIAYFLMSPMNGIYNNYWTVSIPHLGVEWWMFVVIPIIVFLSLYLLNILVVFWTLRHNTQSLLNSSSEFRMNWFIISTKWITAKLSSINSFRWTFMMGNITRFLILTFVVFAFSSLISIVVGSLNQFDNALSYTNRNKSYTYSYDLYSPTIAGGYYSPMSYDQIGISQMGMYNNYSTFGQDGNYLTPNDPANNFAYSGEGYANALLYQYGSNKYFTSLFMPSTKVATEITSNLQFFNNKVFTKLDLDIDLDIAGATINPWELAQQVMPKSIISLADNYLQKQIQLNYDFYYWLQTENDKNVNVNVENQTRMGTKPIIYSTYLPNVNVQPFTIDGSNLSDDLNNIEAQKKWIFWREKDKLTGEYLWALNQDVAALGAPTYMIRPKAVQLIVQILTNSLNPLFNYWYQNVYTNGLKLPNYGFKVANGVAVVEPNDETYTYLTSQVSKYEGKQVALARDNQPVKARIVGIKPNSKFITLYDDNNEDLKPLLSQTLPLENNQVVYPIIINDVVKKKYGFKNGDLLKVSTSNTFDRFNLINLNKNPNQDALFKVVGITNTKSEEQYFTLQKYANQILGFENFNSPDTPKNWNGPHNPGKGYIPFNGVFTSQNTPDAAMNFGGLYSPSGLSTAKGAWNTEIGLNGVTGGEMGYMLIENSKDINPITMVNYVVDRNDNNKVVELPKDEQNPFVKPGYVGYEEVGEIIRKIVKVYGSTMPIVAQLQNIDSPLINSIVGTSIDTTFLNIETVVIASLVPTLIVIIILLAFMIVVEARRLISLMKVLGFSDLSNAFSFMFVYIVVLFLGILLSVPFTFGMLSLVSMISFAVFNIIISPVAPVWIFFAAFGAVGLVFFMLFVYVWTQLKKINLPQAIAVR